MSMRDGLFTYMTSPRAKTLGLAVASEHPGGGGEEEEEEEGGSTWPLLETDTPATDKFSPGVNGDLGK